jgi:alkylation response protein AidB-like acyl-CoA dehydrogenase
VYGYKDPRWKALYRQWHQEVGSFPFWANSINLTIGPLRWITNGHFSDYFTVACKTDKGLTVFLIERGEGVETKPIKTSYSSTAGTAFITFDNVKVPAESMLGPENGGLLVVLSNFNHERWVIAGSSARTQRLIVEECLKYGSVFF